MRLIGGVTAPDEKKTIYQFFRAPSAIHFRIAL